MKWTKNTSYFAFQLFSEFLAFGGILVLSGSSVTEKLSILGMSFEIIAKKVLPDDVGPIIIALISLFFLMLFYLLWDSLHSLKPKSKRTKRNQAKKGF